MRIDIITLFPEMFTPVLGDSIIGRAQKSGALEIPVSYTHLDVYKRQIVNLINQIG